VTVNFGRSVVSAAYSLAVNAFELLPLVVCDIRQPDEVAP